MTTSRLRCHWCTASPLYERYHDEEWGRPIADDRRLFEQLSLELFQSGLSWLTILNKREAFRRAFCQFDVAAIARFDDTDVLRLLGDAGIVRHRGKIEAVVQNARCAQALVESGGRLSALLWRHAPDAGAATRDGAAPTAGPQAVKALAKALKQAGWRFLGPTTLYAFMQACGMVNDHDDRCHARAAADDARRLFDTTDGTALQA